MTAEDQHALGLDASCMLQDEIAWLSNFSPNSEQTSKDTEKANNALLAGHLNLVRGLLHCEGVSAILVYSHKKCF